MLATEAGVGTAVNGVTLKWAEPGDAAAPRTRWRLYVFKGGESAGEPLMVHKASAYLIGRDRRVADIPTDHPSCSSQHAVLQYRLVGGGSAVVAGTLTTTRTVKPYLMDLESTNGTFLNGTRMEPARYTELRSGDVLKFGTSSREYVLLSEDAAPPPPPRS